MSTNTAVPNAPSTPAAQNGKPSVFDDVSPNANADKSPKTLGPDGKPATDGQKVTGMKAEGIKSSTGIMLILAGLLGTLAVGLWMVNKTAALIVGLVAVGLVLIYFALRLMSKRQQRRRNQRQNQNRQHGPHGPNDRNGQRQSRFSRLRRRQHSNNGGPGSGRHGGHGPSSGNNRHRRSPRAWWRDRRNRHRTGSQPHGDGPNGRGRYPHNGEPGSKRPRGSNPLSRWRDRRRNRANGAHGPNGGNGAGGRPGPNGSGSGRNTGRHRWRPWRRKGSTNSGGSRGGSSGSGSHGGEGSGSKPYTCTNPGRGRKWYKPWSWFGNGGGSNSGGSGTDGGSGSPAGGNVNGNGGSGGKWRRRFRRLWNWEHHDPAENNYFGGHGNDGTYRINNGKPWRFWHGRGFSWAPWNRWRGSSGDYAGFDHSGSNGGQGSTGSGNSRSFVGSQPYRTYAERGDRPNDGNGRMPSVPSVGQRNTAAISGIATATAAPTGGQEMSGNERVQGATTGVPNAATHINSAGHTQHSTIAHLVDAGQHEQIAQEYINSGDPDLMAAAEGHLRQSAESRAVADNRMRLTAGHTAAASRAIESGGR